MLESCGPGVMALSARLDLPGGRRSSSRSAIRALDILEYLAHVRRPLRATDIALALDLHPSSADQLLKTMVDSAYLLIDPMERTYTPSPRLSRFATWVHEGYDSAALVRLLEAVSARSGELAVISAPQGGWLQIVDLVNPHTFLSDPAKGGRSPMFLSTPGAAYLAAHSDEEALRLMKRLPQLRHLSDDAREDMLTTIRAVRLAGYSCGLHEDVDLFTIAMALPRSAIGVQLVLSVGGARRGMESRVEQLAAILQEAIATELLQI